MRIVIDFVAIEINKCDYLVCTVLNGQLLLVDSEDIISTNDIAGRVYSEVS